ncbi:hypothetical protein KFE25_012783 [Diacronema lutheri]|uniref:Uncharacterized protein n=2 Tax=Diacronema lutheri TaxID=2081491 RepID=A0A8J6C837_DIALT|nr:hypothetical protein KFE25_012783 [Diacronema lutheri]
MCRWAPLVVLLAARVAGDAEEALPEVEPSVLHGWHSAIRDEAGRQYDFVSPYAQLARAGAHGGAAPAAPRFKVIALERGDGAAEGEAELVARVVVDGTDGQTDGADGVNGAELREMLTAALGAEQADALLAAAGMRARAHPPLPELQPDVPLSAVITAIGASLGARTAAARPARRAGDDTARARRGVAVTTSELTARMEAVQAQAHPHVRGADGGGALAAAGSRTAAAATTTAAAAAAGGEGGGGGGAREPLVRAALRTPTPAVAPAMAGAQQPAPAGGDGDDGAFARRLEHATADALRALERELREQRDVLDGKLRAIKERRARLHAHAGAPGARRPSRAGGGEEAEEGEEDDGRGGELGAVLRAFLGAATGPGVPPHDDAAAADADRPSRAKGGGLFAELAASIAADLVRDGAAARRAAAKRGRAPPRSGEREAEPEDEGG